MKGFLKKTKRNRTPSTVDSLTQSPSADRFSSFESGKDDGDYEADDLPGSDTSSLYDLVNTSTFSTVALTGREEGG